MWWCLTVFATEQRLCLGLPIADLPARVEKFALLLAPRLNSWITALSMAVTFRDECTAHSIYYKKNWRSQNDVLQKAIQHGLLRFLQQTSWLIIRHVRAVKRHVWWGHYHHFSVSYHILSRWEEFITHLCLWKYSKFSLYSPVLFLNVNILQIIIWHFCFSVKLPQYKKVANLTR